MDVLRSMYKNNFDAERLATVLVQAFPRPGGAMLQAAK